MAEIRRTPPAASGFTLLELLIVITILGLILAALSNGVRFAGQAWQTQERRSARQGDLGAVQALVRNLIASGTGFEGDSTSLRFVSELPEALARTGLYDVELYTAGGRLVLSWRPHFKGPSVAVKTSTTELARDIAGIEYAYYIAPIGWERMTPDRSKPPALILVTFKLGDGRSSPPFVVAPMVEVDPAVTNL